MLAVGHDIEAHRSGVGYFIIAKSPISEHPITAAANTCPQMMTDVDDGRSGTILRSREVSRRATDVARAQFTP